MKKILIAGGLCGTTMLRIEQDINKRLLIENMSAHIKIQNLWETTFIDSHYDLVIEMFPFFDKYKYKVISGKPYIVHRGEKEVIDKAFEALM